ncbi:type ISP restriction/modification enzyme [Magnetospirillum sp. 15-1]|uniref:type ISP restriction/modification enzyme n=1 Tax=Magnetospirillum sp. 15-1 TaxID=1979370 RepID=UPI001F5B2A49|nr:type ISP restriction/modification enzyme [Magnetospirillum sp. 15-1]
MTTTAPTTRLGLAGLDNDMVARIEAGQLTQAEAARVLGISKQAVGKALKSRREQGGATAPAAAPAKAAPGPADRLSEAQAQSGATAPAIDASEEERLARLAGGAWWAATDVFVRGLTEAQTRLAQGRGKLGATEINGCVRAARECVDGLRGLGLLPPVGGHNDNDKPAELKVTVLAPSEEAEIRAEIAERAGEELDDERDTTAESTPPPVPRQPIALIDRLPDQGDFEVWIAGEVGRRGAAWLRQVVAALGGQIAHGKDQLKMELLRVTGGDPERLQCLVKGGKDKTILHYNDSITVTGIPPEAYEYVVNGKPALDWVVERQCVKTDKDSGIENDANDWAVETMGNPRYPLELFLRVITVSLETMKIVKALPPLDID